MLVVHISSLIFIINLSELCFVCRITFVGVILIIFFDFRVSTKFKTTDFLNKILIRTCRLINKVCVKEKMPQILFKIIMVWSDLVKHFDIQNSQNHTLYLRLLHLDAKKFILQKVILLNSKI